MRRRWQRVAATAGELRACNDRFLSLQPPLRSAEFHVAQFIVNHPWLTPTQLSACLGYSERMLDEYLPRLESIGWIRRRNGARLGAWDRGEPICTAGPAAFDWIQIENGCDLGSYRRYLGLQGDTPLEQRRKTSWRHTFEVIVLSVSAFQAASWQARLGRPRVTVDWEADDLCDRWLEVAPGKDWRFAPDGVFSFGRARQVCTWAFEYARTKHPADLRSQVRNYCELISCARDIDGLLVVVGKERRLNDVAEWCIEATKGLAHAPPVLIAQFPSIDRGAFLNRAWRWTQHRTDTPFSPLDWLRTPLPGEREAGMTTWRTQARPRGVYVGSVRKRAVADHVEPFDGSQRPWWRVVALEHGGMARDGRPNSGDGGDIMHEDDEGKGGALPACTPDRSHEARSAGAALRVTLLPRDQRTADASGEQWLADVTRRILPRWWEEMIDFAALAASSRPPVANPPGAAQRLSVTDGLQAVDVRLAFALAVAGSTCHGTRWWTSLPREACRPGWLVQDIALHAAGVCREEELHRRWGAAVALQASRGGPPWPSWLEAPAGLCGRPGRPMLLVCPRCGDRWCEMCQGYGLVNTLTGEALAARADGTLAQVCPRCHMRPCETCGGSGVVARCSGSIAAWPRGCIYQPDWPPMLAEVAVNRCSTRSRGQPYVTHTAHARRSPAALAAGGRP